MFSGVLSGNPPGNQDPTEKGGSLLAAATGRGESDGLFSNNVMRLTALVSHHQKDWDVRGEPQLTPCSAGIGVHYCHVVY